MQYIKYLPLLCGVGMWTVAGLLFEADKLPVVGFVLLMALGCWVFVRGAKRAGVWGAAHPLGASGADGVRSSAGAPPRGVDCVHGQAARRQSASRD